MQIATYIYSRLIHNGELVEDKEFEGHPKNAFTRYLLSLMRSKTTLTVWAHNASFDVRTGLDIKYLARNDYRITSFCTNPFLLSFKANPKIHLIFLDTFSFFRSSIEVLGSYFGIEKIQIDFTEKDYASNKEKRKLLIERCKRDVKVVEEICKRLYENMYHRINVSAPQMAFAHFRRILDEKIEKCNSLLAQQAYYGGRVELFNRNKSYVKRYDVNSMYPYVMKVNPFPVKLVETVRNPPKEIVKSYLDSGYGLIAKIFVNIPTVKISPFPFRRNDNKIIFPIGRFETILCSPEFEKHLNFIEKFVYVEVYKMKNIFTDYVNHYWNLRKESHGFWNWYYKLMLNYLYGKFAQIDKHTIMLGESDDDNFVGNYEMEVKDVMKLVRSVNGLLFTDEEGDYKYSVAVSAFVTSYARAYLYSKMKECEQSLYYVDTDCLNVDYGIEIPVSSEIGGFKLEKAGLAQFYAPKLYVFGDEIKVKGVPKNWDLQWKGSKLIASGEHFSGLLESVSRFNTWNVIVSNMTKEINLVDDKRIWIGNESKPISLGA